MILKGRCQLAQDLFCCLPLAIWFHVARSSRRPPLSPLVQDKKRFDNEEDLAAVGRLSFYHLSIWCLRNHFMPCCCGTFSTQCKCVSRVSSCFFDGLDVTSVSQGLMLAGYLRLEYLWRECKQLMLENCAGMFATASHKCSNCQNTVNSGAVLILFSQGSGWGAEEIRGIFFFSIWCRKVTTQIKK